MTAPHARPDAPSLQSLGWACFGAAACVLVAAAVLRGRHTPGHDELNFVETGLRMLGSRGNPGEFIHGSLLYDVMAAVHAAMYAMRTVTGAVNGIDEYLVSYVASREMYLLIGRLIVVAFTLVLLYAVKRVGTQLYGERAGALAMALMAFGSVLVVSGTLLKEDAPAAALGMLGLVVVFDGASGLRPAKRWGLGGALYGMGMASKFTLAPIALIPAITALFDASPARATRLAAFAAGGIVGFAVLEPYGLLDAGKLVADIDMHLQQMSAHRHIIAPRYLFDFLPLGLGVPLVMVFVPLAVRTWRRQDIRLKAVVLYIAVAGALCLSSKYGVPRYLLTWVPLMCVVVAGELMQMASLAKARAPVILALVLLLTWPANAIALKYALLLTRPDTRALARAWIERSVRGERRVLVEGTVNDEPSFAPALLGTADWYRAREQAAQTVGGTGRLIHATATFAEQQQRPRYDLTQRELTDADASADFDYFVLSEFDSLPSEYYYILKPDDPEVQVLTSRRAAAIRALDRCCRPLFQIGPTPVLRYDWIANNPDYWRIWAADLTTSSTWVAGPRIRVYGRAHP